MLISREQVHALLLNCSKIRPQCVHIIIPFKEGVTLNMLFYWCVAKILQLQ